MRRRYSLPVTVNIEYWTQPVKPRCEPWDFVIAYCDPDPCITVLCSVPHYQLYVYLFACIYSTYFSISYSVMIFLIYYIFTLFCFKAATVNIFILTKDQMVCERGRLYCLIHKHYQPTLYFPSALWSISACCNSMFRFTGPQLTLFRFTNSLILKLLTFKPGIWWYTF